MLITVPVVSGFFTAVRFFVIIANRTLGGKSDNSKVRTVKHFQFHSQYSFAYLSFLPMTAESQILNEHTSTLLPKHFCLRQ